MSYLLKDIVFEKGPYWVLEVKKGGAHRFDGFEVYKSGITHSTCVAQIGFAGDAGMLRVRAEIDRRISADEATKCA